MYETEPKYPTSNNRSCHKEVVQYTTKAHAIFRKFEEMVDLITIHAYDSYIKNLFLCILNVTKAHVNIVKKEVYNSVCTINARDGFKLIEKY